MYKFFIFLGSSLLGWAGWELGALEGITTAFFTSGVGSIVGVIAGWKLAHWLENL